MRGVSQADIDETYRQFFPAIREKCARMLNDPVEAQDVAQETFLRLWRKGPTGGSTRQTIAWIYQTSTRLAIDRMRRRRAQPTAPELPRSFAIDARPDAEHLASLRQQWSRIARAVPARELELALLARFDGLTQSEIAEVIGIAERTVRRLLARFDARLDRFQEERLHDGRD